jgi:amidase
MSTKSTRRNFIVTASAAAFSVSAAPLTNAAQSNATAQTNSMPQMNLHMSEIIELSAVSLSAAIHTRQISCREVMTAYLAQIERLNPKVNAIVSMQNPEELLKLADERDAQLARGQSMGWMHGFPQAPKDVADAKGFPTTQGSPIFKDHIADHDAFVVERARRSGAIIIGKTNVPEFAMGSHTYNPLFGATGNAFDQAFVAGGSSGGAAVATALRMLPLADGSDMMGSLRNPAGWNNIVALRPSRGRVPFGPTPEIYYQQLGYEGPMARNVPDLAMLLSIQAGFNPGAPLSLEGDSAQFRHSLERDFKGVRVGWLGDYGGYLAIEPDIMTTCKSALRHFQTIGCSVEETKPDFEMSRLWTAWVTLRSWMAYGTLEQLYADPNLRAQMKPEAIWEIENGMKQQAIDIWNASVVRSAWVQALNKLYETYDYLVLPTASVFPFNVETHWPKTVAGRQMDTYHHWMEVAIGGSMSGVPVAAVPAGFNNKGLPIGLQILGPQTQDFAVLQIAYAYDQVSGYGRTRSPLLD